MNRRNLIKRAGAGLAALAAPALTANATCLVTDRYASAGNLPHHPTATPPFAAHYSPHRRTYAVGGRGSQRVCPLFATCSKHRPRNVPGRWMHTDARRLVDLFDKHRNVKACLSAHIHLTDRTGYNGVSYYCNKAVSGAWWFGNYRHTAAGCAPIDLYDDGTVQNGYVAYQ